MKSFLYFFILLFLSSSLLASTSLLRGILGRHYHSAFPDGWAKDCPHSESCCRFKEASQYVLHLREELLSRSQEDSLRELRERYDRITGRLILLNGWSRIAESHREFLKEVVRSMKSSQNPLLFSNGSSGYLNQIEEYCTLGRNGHLPLCRRRPSNIDEHLVKGFLQAYRNMGYQNREFDVIVGQNLESQLANLSGQRDRVRNDMLSIKDAPNYRDYTEMIEDILPHLLRNCDVDTGDITVNKICLTSTPFGEVETFSGNLKNILAYLNRKASLLAEKSQESREEERSLEVQRFLGAHKKYYFVDGKRVGRRPGQGQLFGDALKRSMPLVSQTIMTAVLRPNYDAMYTQGIYSKNREYMINLMSRPNPDFFFSSGYFTPYCLPEFCGQYNPYFNLNPTAGQPISNAQ